MPSLEQFAATVVIFACFAMAHEARVLHFPVSQKAGTGHCAAAAMSFPALLSFKCRNLRGKPCKCCSGTCLLLPLRGGGSKHEHESEGAAAEEEIMDPDEQVYRDYVKAREENADIKDDREDFEDLLQVQHVWFIRD
jgi:hypothetical protein